MRVESPAAARRVDPGEKRIVRTGEDCVGRECRSRVVDVRKTKIEPVGWEVAVRVLSGDYQVSLARWCVGRFPYC